MKRATNNSQRAFALKPGTGQNGQAQQHGLTMVELMIAMAIGLVITMSVLSVYVNSSRNFAMDERYARMQENARYSLRVLSEDLLMVDFWGQIISTDTIASSLTPTTGDCGVDINLFVANSAFLFNNNHATSAVDHFSPCSAISSNRQSDSDILVIKRVEGALTAQTYIDAADSDGDGDITEVISVGGSSLQTGTVYLRSNSISGTLINDASSTNQPAQGWSDWLYIPRIYFLRDYFKTAGDGIPSLCRLDINGSRLNSLSCLAEGVEDMHIEFGLDTDTDGDANRYTANPTVDDMETAVSARIHVLVRSTDTVPFYINNKTYQLGDESIAAANDGYLRNVFTTTVSLRNSSSRNLFN